MRKTNAKRFTSLSEIEIEIGVNVQRDSIAIPPPNHSQSIRNRWFVISFTHVHTTNAKRLKPLSEGMFKEIEIRIGVYVQPDSIAIPSYNYSQSITNYCLSFCLPMCLQQMQNGSNPCQKGCMEKARTIDLGTAR